MESWDQKLKNVIINFCNKNKNFFLQYQKDDPIYSVWDYFDLKIENDHTLSEHPIFEDLLNNFMETMISDENKCIIDLNGHSSLYENKSLKDIKEDVFLNHNFTLEAIKENIKIDIIYTSLNYIFFNAPVVFKLKEGKYFNLKMSLNCSFCDQSIYFDLDLENSRLIAKNNNKLEDCKKMSDEIIFNFNVPSKKLVFVNDSRALIYVNREDKHKFTVNSVLGRLKECNAYSLQGSPYFTLESGEANIIQENGIIKIKNKIEEHNVIGTINLGLRGVFVWDYDNYHEKIKNLNMENLKCDLGDMVIVDLKSSIIEIRYNAKNRSVEIKEKC